MELPEEQGATPSPAGSWPAEEMGDETAAGLGPRVTAVFTAAQQAAEHLMKMARAEAEDLRRRTETELETYRREQRDEARAEAAAILDLARSDAEEIRREAKAEAATLEDAAKLRAQWIDEGIRLAAERAEWGRRGLEEVVERLQEFAVRPPDNWAEVGPPPEAPSTNGEPTVAARTVAEELAAGTPRADTATD
jgi:hypothetical protein